VRRLSDAPRRVGEGVNESFGPIVPAVPASILFFARNHALTRVSAPCRRFARLVCLPKRSKHKAPNHFETSLEEAAVSRVGLVRPGWRTAKSFERRRRGTAV